eukprot:CAMPEP_0171323864 /NCGR_PEP_ID=MMETSP0816-20121228/115842_1 /TAXON_ID=420281 /ORGANISM="Proboscia inermis, Strain CCAP1064/1" /LENGTH=95 /DNA_ID=CAMNT_0011822679 /DNA_START=687 /DNA_END=974 /DNA_ORIENTATION=-
MIPGRETWGGIITAGNFPKTVLVFTCKTVDDQFERSQELMPHAHGADAEDSNSGVNIEMKTLFLRTGILQPGVYAVEQLFRWVSRSAVWRRGYCD